MEYFLKENKRYLLMVGGGLAFFFLYHGLVIGKIRGAADLAERTPGTRSPRSSARWPRRADGRGLTSARRDRDLNRKVLAKMGRPGVHPPRPLPEAQARREGLLRQPQDRADEPAAGEGGQRPRRVPQALACPRT